MNKNFDPIKILSTSKFIFKEPIARGMFIWRRRGIQLVENIFKRLVKKLESENEVELVYYNNLINKKLFHLLYKNINDYKNTFECVDENFIIRPEVSYDLFNSLKNGPNREKIIATNMPLYRQFRSQPFIIDQRIWPAVSFCLLADKNKSLNKVKSLVGLLNLFYDDLLLPRIWIEQLSGFKRFSKTMFLPLMPEDNKNLTIVSTLFILSDNFSKKLNIETSDLIQFGFSERLLATYCRFQEDQDFVIWPSQLIPDPIIIDGNIESDLKDFLFSKQLGYLTSNLNIQIKDLENNRINKDIQNYGSPLFIFKCSNKKYYYLIINKETGILHDYKYIPDLLKKSDELLMNHNSNYFNNCLSKINKLYICDKCLSLMNNIKSIGTIYPNSLSMCGKCNSNDAFEHILIPIHTKKTISEKLG